MFAMFTGADEVPSKDELPDSSTVFDFRGVDVVSYTETFHLSTDFRTQISGRLS
jgi:hypothetical protein